MTGIASLLSLPLLAQAGGGGTGFPFVDTLIVLAGIGGAVFAVCRSANRG
ncbi:hypothetical protein GYB59_10815 [bacterium]|nr:hypothetical protein [Rubinisphaera sp. JC750]MBR9802144.1 hypothetical protein [bacterium]